MNIRSAKLKLLQSTLLVMPGLVPDIRVFTAIQQERLDGRDEPGHDVERTFGFALADYRFGSG